MHATLACPLIGGWAQAPQMQSLATAVLAEPMPTGLTVRFLDEPPQDVPLDAPTDLVGISVQTFTTEFGRRHIPVVADRFHAVEVERQTNPRRRLIP